MTGQERLSALERDRKDLADEYVGLKANYSSLKGAHDREVGVLSTFTFDNIVFILGLSGYFSIGSAEIAN